MILSKKNKSLFCRVQKLINLGASKEKLIVGIPTYGRSFTLSSTAVEPPNAYFSGAGLGGPILEQSGFLGYQEICLNLKNNGWTEVDLCLHMHIFEFFKVIFLGG